jgi:hypothetical protein
MKTAINYWIEDDKKAQIRYFLCEVYDRTAACDGLPCFGVNDLIEYSWEM